MPSILCHKGYFYLSPVLAYDFLSPGKFSTLQQWTVSYTLQIDRAPCRLEPHGPRNKKSLFILYSTAYLQYYRQPEHEVYYENAQKEPHVRNCSAAEGEGLYENVQQNPQCAVSCFTILRIFPSSHGSRLITIITINTIFYRDANSILLSTPLYRVIGSMRRTLCSKLLIRRA